MNLDKHVKLMSSAIIGLPWQKSVIKFVARILPVEISARRILLLKFQSNFNQFLVLSGKKIYIYAISAIRDKTTNYILYNSTKLCRELLFQCWFNQLKLCVIFLKWSKAQIKTTIKLAQACVPDFQYFPIYSTTLAENSCQCCVECSQDGALIDTLHLSSILS